MPTASATDTAKLELEAARADVLEGEKEIQEVKAALRQLQSAANADGSSNEEAPNSLEIAVLKVEGLPEGAQPSFALQLSSPIEELVLDKVFDPLAPTENIAVFSGVETSVATLTVSAKDADIDLGTSALYEVAPLCKVDPMSSSSSQPQSVTELAVAIVAETKEEAKEEVFEDSKEDLPPESSSAAAAANDDEKGSKGAVAQPVCTVTLRVTYKPSAKDQREELYDLLNKASQKKAKAIDQLRKNALAAARAGGPSSTDSTTTMTTALASSKTSKSSSSAVQPGFLNKKSKKETSKIRAWYEKNLGPQSFLRQTLFPISKNYIIFFGTIALCHYKGHELALPVPV